ncbi:hypothetical protein EIN_318060 [Entamoeba invadens IP1]|uniref:J domain-containing protein n=1 Tax=Entamoeba invadens IP1 TaxID=370355 RepID=A0A0A1TZH4_ENTIV|nr:hypothetical protein EIN_318060 [Entamoeba invadens IP1]ELP86987.1 hypothetical protein EIN_318060 [Entamoeba invadens IP1]|eukprot:XP_004253758.1 hypothetical protein EIN_318060 [Entamoeba invadens IP1]
MEINEKLTNRKKSLTETIDEENKPIIPKETPKKKYVSPFRFTDPYDYYKILDINTNATDEEITAAYKSVSEQIDAEKSHDKSDKDRMIMVEKAYSVLSDPFGRIVYDRIGVMGESLGTVLDSVMQHIVGYVIGAVVLFIFLVCVYFAWVGLLLARLDIPKEWPISASNVPLYFLYALTLFHFSSSLVGKITGTISNFSYLVGLILFFVRLDIGGDTSYQLWLVPFYVGVLFSVITHVFDYCTDYPMTDTNGNTVTVGRELNIKLLNVGLDIVPFAALATTFAFIGIQADSTEKDFSIPTILACVYVVTSRVSDYFKDLKLGFFRLISSSVTALFLVVQIVLIGFNVGSRHKFLYTYSFIPTLLVGAFAMLTIVVGLPISFCLFKNVIFDPFSTGSFL